MNRFQKIIKSWWVIPSFIIFINGLGFMYLGSKTQNRRWVIEGFIYEIPWIFMIPFFTVQQMYIALVSIAYLLMLISIIRSFWVNMKYLDMLEMYI